MTIKRRTVLAGLSALPLAAIVRPVLAVDTLATSGGEVGIHPVAHASLALTFGNEVIYVDPAENSFAGLPTATAIVITHAHPDHFNPDNLVKLAGDVATLVVNEDVFGKLPEALKSRATALANGASGRAGSVPVDAVAAYNTTADRLQYHPQGVGNGYVFGFGDKRVYVAGDTEPTPEMLALENIDIAFLPMNLPYTMSVEQAAEAVKGFAPKVVYPYHSRGSDLDAFKAAVGDASEVRIAAWYPAA